MICMITTFSVSYGVNILRKLQHHLVIQNFWKLLSNFIPLPNNNSITERVFSLISSQWTKERNGLMVENVKGIICVQNNFKSLSCVQFHDYLLENKKLLVGIGSSDKYQWHHKDTICYLITVAGSFWVSRSEEFYKLPADGLMRQVS